MEGGFQGAAHVLLLISDLVSHPHPPLLLCRVCVCVCVCVCENLWHCILLISMHFFLFKNIYLSGFARS